MTSCVSAYPQPHPVGLLRRHHFKQYIDHPHSDIPIYIYIGSSTPGRLEGRNPLVNCSGVPMESSIVHETDVLARGTDSAMDELIDTLLTESPEHDIVEFPIDCEDSLDNAVDTYVDSLIRVADGDVGDSSMDYSTATNYTAEDSTETVELPSGGEETVSSCSSGSEETVSPETVQVAVPAAAPAVQYIYSYPTKKIMKSYIIKNQIVYIIRDFATGIVSVVRKAIR
jgi:hypothetical protein